MVEGYGLGSLPYTLTNLVDCSIFLGDLWMTLWYTWKTAETSLYTFCILGRFRILIRIIENFIPGCNVDSLLLWNFRVMQRFLKVLLNSFAFFRKFLFEKILDIFPPGFSKGNQDRNILQRISGSLILMRIFENRNSYRVFLQEIPRGFLHGAYQ